MVMLAKFADEYAPQNAMNSAATSGPPITKPLIPNITMPPRVDKSTR